MTRRQLARLVKQYQERQPDQRPQSVEIVVGERPATSADGGGGPMTPPPTPQERWDSDAPRSHPHAKNLEIQDPAAPLQVVVRTAARRTRPEGSTLPPALPATPKGRPPSVLPPPPSGWPPLALPHGRVAPGHQIAQGACYGDPKNCELCAVYVRQVRQYNVDAQSAFNMQHARRGR